MVVNLSSRKHLPYYRKVIVNKYEKVQEGNDQEKAQSEKDPHSKNRTNNQVLIP